MTCSGGSVGSPEDVLKWPCWVRSWNALWECWHEGISSASWYVFYQVSVSVQDKTEPRPSFSCFLRCAFTPCPLPSPGRPISIGNMWNQFCHSFNSFSFPPQKKSSPLFSTVIKKTSHPKPSLDSTIVWSPFCLLAFISPRWKMYLMQTKNGTEKERERETKKERMRSRRQEGEGDHERKQSEGVECGGEECPAVLNTWVFVRTFQRSGLSSEPTALVMLGFSSQHSQQ